MKWADEEFGPQNIDTIVFHKDESKPHLHIILLPPAPGVEACPVRRKQKEVHRAYKGQKHQMTLTNQAYRDAGSGIQDCFFSAVSIHFGHERKRPPDEQKRRLKPSEQRAKKTYEKGVMQRADLLMQQTEAAIRERQRQIEANEAESKEKLEAQAAELALQANQLAVERAQLEEERGRLMKGTQSEATGSQNKALDETKAPMPADSSVKESKRTLSGTASKAHRAQRKVVDTTQIPLELPTLGVPRANDYAPTPFRPLS